MSDEEVRMRSLELAHQMWGNSAPPLSLIGLAQQFEAYVREGRTLHPQPSESKAAEIEIKWDARPE